MGKEDQSHTQEQQHRSGRSADASEIAATRGEQVSVGSAQRGEAQHEEQSDFMALTEAQRQTQQASERAQAKKAGKESPFLSVLMERGIAMAVARELLQEKRQKAERHKQHASDYYYRQREADPEGLREKERVKKANYRARKRQEAKAQEGQKSQDNRS